jgi:hypothetical protein
MVLPTRLDIIFSNDFGNISSNQWLIMSKAFQTFNEFYHAIREILQDRNDLNSIKDEICYACAILFNPLNTNTIVKSSLGNFKFNKMEIPQSQQIVYKGIHLPQTITNSRYKFAVECEHGQTLYTIITINLNDANDLKAEYARELTKLDMV